MADTLAASLKTTLSWDRIEGTAVGTRRDKKSLSTSLDIADGSLAGQADRVFHDTRVIPANGVDALDLGSLTQQMFTATVPMNFSVVRLIRVRNNDSTTGRYIHVGADEVAPFTSYALRVGSGSIAVLSSFQEGWSVNSGNQVLRVANPSSVAVEYEIVIIGA